MKIDHIGLAFTQECLRAALLVSLLSVWALVGLFYYLNRYTRRDYFSILTGGWLFYALWLTIGLGMGDALPGSILFVINQICVSFSAFLLLWGSMRFLGIPLPPRLSVVFGVFLSVWIFATAQMTTDSLQIHLPVFILLGLSTPFAGICFLRFRKENSFVGMGTLSLGFLLWVIYVGSCPFLHDNGDLFSVGFFVAAALQLAIAISMIVLLFGEVRSESQKVREEIEKVRASKEAYQDLYNQMRASKESDTSFRRRQQATVEQARLKELNEMAGDVAHEINNALTPITAYSELLLHSLRDLPELPRQRLQQICDAAEDVAKLVANMRDFYRPVAPGEQARKTDFRPTYPPVSTLQAGQSCRSLRILCIDDEPRLRQVMHDVLETDHHQVTIAKGGREGYDLFRSKLESTEPYEVVITDLCMPEFDGHHVARAIKAASPETPVIMLTGWGTMMKADGKTEPSVDAVLSKPPRVQELSDLLFRFSSGKVSLS